MWSEHKHVGSREVGGTTTSMLAAGEVIKNVGCNVFFSHSFTWGGVNSRVDIAIWLHNIDVGVEEKKKKKKGQGSRFLPKTEASALNRGYLGAALLICLFLFCDKREHETARERLEQRKKIKINVWCGHQWPHLPLGESHGEWGDGSDMLKLPTRVSSCSKYFTNCNKLNIPHSAFATYFLKCFEKKKKSKIESVVPKEILNI